MILIGICGGTASGKTTLSNKIAEYLTNLNFSANEISLEECINKGQQVTRNYVKRQHTWWKSSKLEIFQKFDQFPSETDINSIKIN